MYYSRKSLTILSSSEIGFGSKGAADKQMNKTLKVNEGIKLNSIKNNCEHKTK